MRMRHSNTIARAAWLIPLAVACGTDPEARYDCKTYGAVGYVDEDCAAIPEGQRGGAGGREPGSNGGEGGIGDLEIEKDELIFNAHYRGFILADSIRFLDEGAEYDFDEVKESVPRAVRFVLPQVEQLITDYSTKHIDLIAKQTYGDGKIASFTQAVDSPLDSVGGSIKYFESEGDSGFFVYDRVLDDEDCPTGFICVSRMLSGPKLGEDGDHSTTCFFDALSGEATTIPYGVSPGIVPRDIPKPVTVLGDFEIRVVEEKEANCAETSRPEAPLFVRIKGVRETDEREMAELSKTSKSYDIDFGVRIEMELLKGLQDIESPRATIPNNFAPYIDDKAGLQANTTYYFNVENGSLVKITKEVRKAFAMLPISYEGVKLVVDFYLCKDFLQNSKDFCEEDETGPQE